MKNETKPTQEEKGQYFAAHWGQEIMYGNDEKEPYTNMILVMEHLCRASNANYKVLLTSLADITDEDAIEVARLCHNFKDDPGFKLERLNDILHCRYIDESIYATYHICLNYKHATINCNLNFAEVDKETKLGEASNHKINIAEIQFSSERVVGYISALDYLRSKGYAVPFRNYTLQQLISFGWLKLRRKGGGDNG